MAVMNPILKLRQSFRAMGADEEQADEAAEAVEQHSYGRAESDARFREMLAEHRAEMERIKNQFLFGVLVIVGAAVAILAVVN